MCTDDGDEFAAVKEVKRIIRNPNAQDYDEIKAINFMCAYIRKRIWSSFAAIGALKHDIGEEDDNGKRKIDLEMVKRILKEIINQHNYEKEVRKFQKVPSEISREEVDEENEKELQKKGIVFVPPSFDFGDIVKCVLKTQKLDKGRYQKWSEGTYKIIDYRKPYYLLVPSEFN